MGSLRVRHDWCDLAAVAATPSKKRYDQPRQHIKKQRYYFASKGPSSQGNPGRSRLATDLVNNGRICSLSFIIPSLLSCALAPIGLPLWEAIFPWISPVWWQKEDISLTFSHIGHSTCRDRRQRISCAWSPSDLLMHHFHSHLRPRWRERA